MESERAVGVGAGCCSSSFQSERSIGAPALGQRAAAYAASVTPKEYEAYVASVVHSFDFCAGATVIRNKRFPGIRQPGMYEIDIAVELFLSEHVFFRMIVECKNHGRPVTRPVVQQLAQTRDAIAAHKAAIASPTGFSGEAIDVARDLGIALWVMAQDVPTSVIMGLTGPYVSPYTGLYYALRLEYLQLFGINPAGEDLVKLLDANRTEPVPDPPAGLNPELSARNERMFGAVRERCAFYRPISVGSAVADPEPEALFDPDCAQAQVANWAVAAVHENLAADADIHARIGRWELAARERVSEQSVSDGAVAAAAIESIKVGDRWSFLKLLDDSRRQRRLKIDPFPPGESRPSGPGGWLRCVVCGGFSSRRTTCCRRRGVGAVAEFGLVGAGGDGVPGGAVLAGVVGELGEHSFGLVDEAGEQGDGGERVAEPFPAPFGELVEGVVDEVVGVVAAARPGWWPGWSLLFSVVVAGGGDAAEVAVLEAVAVAFEADDVGVVDEAVDHGDRNRGPGVFSPAGGVRLPAGSPPCPRGPRRAGASRPWSRRGRRRAAAGHQPGKLVAASPEKTRPRAHPDFRMAVDTAASLLAFIAWQTWAAQTGKLAGLSRVAGAKWGAIA